MKPTPLSEYLATPAENRAPGWVVVMRGAGAPSVVHASRGAAEAEASRLIDGLPGNVDQTALVLPIASVLTRKKDVRQPIVGEAFPTEERPKIVVKEFPSTPAPLSIKPHGIYERQDGVIVAWEDDETSLIQPSVPMQHKVGGVWYSPNGKCSFGSMNLVREIVVGEGWKPWNGGECPVEPRQMIEIVTRGNIWGKRPAANYCWQRYVTKHLNDIVAYREAMPF